ncbi:MAG TPA: hypothetical protein VFT31_16600 [Kribbella sp.]|nr:hypothetical protein [Kribbella sp.]
MYGPQYVQPQQQPLTAVCPPLPHQSADQLAPYAGRFASYAGAGPDSPNRKLSRRTRRRVHARERRIRRSRRPVPAQAPAW